MDGQVMAREGSTRYCFSARDEQKAKMYHAWIDADSVVPMRCPTVLDRPCSLEHNQLLGATSYNSAPRGPTRGRRSMTILFEIWVDDQGQDIAEYAVMLAVILVLVVGTVRLIGSNANNAFSTVASALQ